MISPILGSHCRVKAHHAKFLKSRSFEEIDPETIVVIIWGLVKRGRWLEAEKDTEVKNLNKMKTGLG